MSKSRISKDPEVRKNEIIAAAEELFLTQGFAETAISDIVKKVGVAQGLFYYYFKSKNEILDAVVDRFAEHFMTELETIVKNKWLNGAQKLQAIFARMFQFQSQNEKLVYYIHEERNELHHRLEQKSLSKMVELLYEIIEEGVWEKVFTVDYPQETVEILFAGLGTFWHSLLRLMVEDPKQFAQKIHASIAVIEKALGAAKGSLQIELSVEIGDNHG